MGTTSQATAYNPYENGACLNPDYNTSADTVYNANNQILQDLYSGFLQVTSLPTPLCGTITTAGSVLGISVEDAAATFITNGITGGLPICNGTDGSIGIVATVPTETTITTTTIFGGTDNEFQVGDTYCIGAVDGQVVTLTQVDGTNNPGQYIYDESTNTWIPLCPCGASGPTGSTGSAGATQPYTINDPSDGDVTITALEIQDPYTGTVITYAGGTVSLPANATTCVWIDATGAAVQGTTFPTAPMDVTPIGCFTTDAAGVIITDTNLYVGEPNHDWTICDLPTITTITDTSYVAVCNPSGEMEKIDANFFLTSSSSLAGWGCAVKFGPDGVITLSSSDPRIARGGGYMYAIQGDDVSTTSAGQGIVQVDEATLMITGAFKFGSSLTGAQSGIEADDDFVYALARNGTTWNLVKYDHSLTYIEGVTISAPTGTPSAYRMYEAGDYVFISPNGNAGTGQIDGIYAFPKSNLTAGAIISIPYGDHTNKIQNSVARFINNKYFLFTADAVAVYDATLTTLEFSFDQGSHIFRDVTFDGANYWLNSTRGVYRLSTAYAWDKGYLINGVGPTNANLISVGTDLWLFLDDEYFVLSTASDSITHGQELFSTNGLGVEYDATTNKFYIDGEFLDSANASTLITSTGFAVIDATPLSGTHLSSPATTWVSQPQTIPALTVLADATAVSGSAFPPPTAPATVETDMITVGRAVLADPGKDALATQMTTPFCIPTP